MTTTPKDQSEPKQCPTCRGNGKWCPSVAHFCLDNKKCPTCHGTGLAPVDQELAEHVKKLADFAGPYLEETQQPTKADTVADITGRMIYGLDEIDKELKAIQQSLEPTKADTCETCGGIRDITAEERNNDWAECICEPTKPETAVMNVTDDSIVIADLPKAIADLKKNTPQPEATEPKIPANISLTCGSLDCPERTGGECRGIPPTDFGGWTWDTENREWVAPANPQNLQSHDKLDELRQQLASIEHERWSDWQRYMHDKMRLIPDSGGDMRVWESDYKHWERQIVTPYAELSPAEQKSDMEQVERYWPLITAYLDQHTAARVAEARISELNLNAGAISRARINETGRSDEFNAGRYWAEKMLDNSIRNLTNKKEAEGQNE